MERLEESLRDSSENDKFSDRYCGLGCARGAVYGAAACAILWAGAAFTVAKIVDYLVPDQSYSVLK